MFAHLVIWFICNISAFEHFSAFGYDYDAPKRQFTARKCRFSAGQVTNRNKIAEANNVFGVLPNKFLSTNVEIRLLGMEATAHAIGFLESYLPIGFHVSHNPFTW